VRGYLDYQREGLGEPEEVRDATPKGTARRWTCSPPSSRIGASSCIPEGQRRGQRTVHRLHKDWCAEAGEDAISQRKFGRQLGERGFVKDKSGTIIWHGIGLRADRPDPDDSGGEGPDAGPSAPKGPEAESSIGKGSSADGAESSGPSGPEIDIKSRNQPLVGFISKKVQKVQKPPTITRWSRTGWPD
jgi:hypothetical protein